MILRAGRNELLRDWLARSIKKHEAYSAYQKAIEQNMVTTDVVDQYESTPDLRLPHGAGDDLEC